MKRARLLVFVTFSCVSLLLFESDLTARQRNRKNAGRAPMQEREQELEEYVFERVTEREYQQAFDELWPKGYRPDKAKVESVDGEVKFSLLMRRPVVPVDCVAKHLLTDDKFQELDREMQGRDFNLRIHETFTWLGTDRHLAVWMRESKAKPLVEIWRSAKRIPSNGKTHRRFRSVDDMMQQFLFENQVPGATLAISRDGQLIYEKGFGYSDIEQETEMLPDTQMRIASVTKPITAAAIMRLADQGKLSLDEPVFQTILAPEDEPTDQRLLDITVDHLLRHRGGWDRGKSYDPMFIQDRVSEHFGVKTPVNPDRIIEYMMKQPLDFEPGSREAYSNFGYSVLGRLIERVSGKSYEDYVQSEILDPVGAGSMKIGGTLKSELQENETRYYTRSGGLTDESVAEPGKFDQPVQYGGWDLTTLDSHGGWIASASDLVRFASAFDQPEDCDLMSLDAIKTMFVPIDLGALKAGRRGVSRYYCYGWRVVINKAGQANAYHSGKLAGTSTLLLRRYDGLSWAILFNCESDPEGKTLSSKIDPLIHQAVNAINW